MVKVKTTDYWFNPVTLDQQASYIDSFTKTDNGYNVKGWMVSDQSINKLMLYLILLNDGSEIDRVHVDLTFPSRRSQSLSKYLQLAKEWL